MARHPAALDPKEEALRRGVDAVLRTWPRHGAPAACLLVAEALFAWVRHGADPRRLVDALSETMLGLEARRAPLLAPLGRELPEPGLDSLAEQLQGLLSGHAWDYSDGERLGAIFETHLNPTQRKAHGAFYTPRPIVDYLLDAALPPREHPLPRGFRLLDPSCGAGNFLSAAMEALFERAWCAEPGSEGRFIRLKRVVGDCLVGIDLNGWALRLAQVRLNFVQFKLVPELERPLALELIDRDALQEHAPVLEGGFDAIVGNPPYGATITPDGKQFFARHYRLGQGRQDTTALFIERCARLLRPGGKLALVVPHGVTRTGAYAPARDLLLGDLRLTAMIDLGSAFAGVNLETMAFVAEAPRSALAEPHMPWAPRSAHLVRLDSLRDGQITPIGTQALDFFAGRTTLPIYADQANGGWIRQLEERGTPLQELAAIRRGAGISAKDQAVALRAEGLPVVRGRDIRRWGDQAGWLRLHPGYLLRDRFRHQVLDRERIAYQNIASAVVATMLPIGCLPLDTVNVLEPATDLDPHYLLGVLNSRLLESYFRLAIANKAQLTLHLDTPTLGMLPIAVPDPAAQAEVARRVRERLAAECGTSPWDLALELEGRPWPGVAALEKAARAWHGDLVLARAHARTLEEDVEAWLSEAYGLSQAERERIDAHAVGRGRPAPASRQLAKAAEIVLVRGLMRVLEPSDRPREVSDLLRSWPRPDAEVWLEAWGGREAQLPAVLERWGAVVHGRRVSLWRGSLQLIG